MSTIRLVTSSNSVRNTTISCDSLGIQYEVRRQGDGVAVKRVDKNKTFNKSVLVGEFSLHKFHKDVIRFGPSTNGGWTPLKEFLGRPGNIFSSDGIFTGNDGVRYRWHPGPRHLKLHAETGGKGTLLSYNRHRFKASYLEIQDPSVLNSLDYIILTFLIVERKRRNKKRRENTNTVIDVSAQGVS